MRSENSAPTRSAQHLIAASQDKDENVRRAAAKALKKIGASEDDGAGLM
jgi:HEAT repeat protein